MRRTVWLMVGLLGVLAAGSLAQGPLTSATNLAVRTSGGDLLVYAVAAGGAQGPLRNFGNTLLRTYGGGDLGVVINGGTVTPDTICLDATNQDACLTRPAANILQLAAGDSFNLNPAGVRLSSDGDGAITFLGLGDGFDEDLTLNLDDTANTAVVSSSTGLNMVSLSGISAAIDVGSETTSRLLLSGPTGNDGIYGTATVVGFFVDGGTKFSVDGSGAEYQVTLDGDVPLGFGTGTRNPDLILRRHAADTLALRRGTNAQAQVWEGRFVSATDFNRVRLENAYATLSGVSGATATATSLIPDGAVVVGVTTTVTTGLGVTNGTTGYQVGDGSDPDRWGAITGTAAGTDTDNTDWTVTTVQAFTSANNVVITAVGGNFDGTGVIVVHVAYLIGQAD